MRVGPVWLAVLNSFPRLKHSFNLYFVNLEIEMSPVSMCDWQLSSTLGALDVHFQNHFAIELIRWVVFIHSKSVLYQM